MSATSDTQDLDGHDLQQRRLLPEREGERERERERRQLVGVVFVEVMFVRVIFFEIIFMQAVFLKVMIIICLFKYQPTMHAGERH